MNWAAQIAQPTSQQNPAHKMRSQQFCRTAVISAAQNARVTSQQNWKRHWPITSYNMMGPLVPDSFLKFPQTLFTLHDFAKGKKLAKSSEDPAPKLCPYTICKIVL